MLESRVNRVGILIAEGDARRIAAIREQRAGLSARVSGMTPSEVIRAELCDYCSA
jgi:hypothetical protein